MKQLIALIFITLVFAACHSSPAKKGEYKLTVQIDGLCQHPTLEAYIDIDKPFIHTEDKDEIKYFLSGVLKLTADGNYVLETKFSCVGFDSHECGCPGPTQVMEFDKPSGTVSVNGPTAMYTYTLSKSTVLAAEVKH